MCGVLDPRAVVVIYSTRLSPLDRRKWLLDQFLSCIPHVSKCGISGPGAHRLFSFNLLSKLFAPNHFHCHEREVIRDYKLWTKETVQYCLRSHGCLRRIGSKSKRRPAIKETVPTMKLQSATSLLCEYLCNFGEIVMRPKLAKRKNTSRSWSA